MSINELGSIGEFLGAIAVLVTLLFIAYQVRQNNRALKWQTSLQFAHQLEGPFFNSPELVRTKLKIKEVDGSMPVIDAFADRYSLEPGEAELWFRHLSLMWLQLEADFHYGQKIEDKITFLMTWQDQKLYWEHAGGFGKFGDDFVSHVKKVASRN